MASLLPSTAKLALGGCPAEGQVVTGVIGRNSEDQGVEAKALDSGNDVGAALSPLAIGVGSLHERPIGTVAGGGGPVEDQGRGGSSCSSSPRGAGCGGRGIVHAVIKVLLPLLLPRPSPLPQAPLRQTYPAPQRCPARSVHPTAPTTGSRAPPPCAPALPSLPLAPVPPPCAPVWQGQALAVRGGGQAPLPHASHIRAPLCPSAAYQKNLRARGWPQPLVDSNPAHLLGRQEL